MKKRFWLAFGIAVLAGTGLHFLYDVCPVPLVGLFAPVNESVWEHLKLFFWPCLLYTSSDYYVNGGSHGCVNTPESAMKTIFDNINVGDPVLVFGKNQWYDTSKN